MVIPKEKRAQRLSVSLRAPSRGLVFGHFCLFFRAAQHQAAASHILLRNIIRVCSVVIFFL